MFCAKLVLYNVHIDALIEQPYNRNIFCVIIILCKKLCVVMRPNILKNSNNLLKQLFFMHLTKFLSKISVVECSYQSVN
jgi:hypothetical protein